MTYPHLFLLLENPHNDPHRGGEAEDPGGSADEPGHSSGQCGAVPAHPLLHHGAVSSSAAVGVQDGLRASGEGRTCSCLLTSYITAFYSSLNSL